MIRLLFLCLCIWFSMQNAQAQFVTISDPDFKLALMDYYPDCFNVNEDLDTVCAATKTGTLDISGYGFADMTGIRYFKSITTLYCYDNSLTFLPALPNSLTELACGGNQLTSLPNLPSTLTYLECYSNQLSSLPNLPSNLTYLDCSGNIDLRCLPLLPNNLESLYLPDSVFSLQNKPSSVINFNHFSGVSYNDFPVCPLSNCACYVAKEAYAEGLFVYENGVELDIYHYTPDSYMLLDTFMLNNFADSITIVRDYQIDPPPNKYDFKDCRVATVVNNIPYNTSVDSDTILNWPPNLKTLRGDLNFGDCRLKLKIWPAFPEGLEIIEILGTGVGGSYVFYSADQNIPITLPSTLKKLVIDYCYLDFVSFPNGLTHLSLNKNMRYNPFLVIHPQYETMILPALPNNLSVLELGAGFKCLPIFPNNLDTLRIASTYPSIPNVPANLNATNTFVFTYAWGSFIETAVNPQNLLIVPPTCERVYIIPFADLNSNGIQEANEPEISGLTVTDGFYSNITKTTFTLLRTTTGNHDFELYAPNMVFTTPNVVNKTIIAGVMDTIYFGVRFPAGYKDLKLNTITGITRPGFNANHTLVCENNAMDVAYNVKVKFKKDPIQTFVSSSITPMISGDTLIWTIDSIPALSSKSIPFVLNIVPTVNLGTQLPYEAWILPNLADAIPNDNYSLGSITVVGSYDPNDKKVSPEVQLPTSNSPFDYTIRFQNTGNFPAEFVVVRDTFDNNLDLSTFEMVGASHPYSFDMINRTGVWTFSNIQLADSFSNEPASHGFIRFRVKPNPNLALGTQIPNTAAIYFDYNTPVITNNAIAKIDNLVVWDKFMENKVKVFPNPSAGLVQIVNGDERIGQLEIYTIQGQLLDSQIHHASSTEVNLSHYPAGIYFLKTSQWSVRVVKQ